MLSQNGRGTIIEISVRPKAGRCRIVDASGARVRIEVSAPPEGGRATQQAMKTLAAALDVPLESLELLTGKTTHHKTILVTGVDAALCETRLAAATQERGRTGVRK